MIFYLRLLKEHLVSKEILRQSEANVTEIVTGLHISLLLRICLCFRQFCLLHVDSLLEWFDLAHFYLQDILNALNKRDLKFFV